MLYDHLVTRALERDISPEMILDIMKNHNISYPGNIRGKNRMAYVKDRIKIITDIDEDAIVTVMREEDNDAE